MKKYVIMFLLLATPSITYNMDYFNKLRNNLWQKYVEWRNPEIVQKLQEQKTIEEKKKNLPVVINEYYEREKPLYIKFLSTFSPLEKEETVVARAYDKLNNNFNRTFYPDNPTQFFIDLNKLSNNLLNELESIRSLILYGKQHKVKRVDFNNLKEKIIKFIKELEKTEGLSDDNKKSLTRFKTFLGNLSTILDQPRITQIEHQHRNRIFNRMKEYINLK